MVIQFFCLKVQTQSLEVLVYKQKQFPQLLKPYIMDYFWKVASGHVHKFIQSELLQNIIYVCECHFQMNFVNMPLKQNGMKNAIEGWEHTTPKYVSFMTRTFSSYVLI